MQTLKNNQQFPVNVEGRDSKNNVAPFENPVFAVSDPNLGTFEVDPNNPQAGVFKAGNVGTGQLSFVADGIIGAGEGLVTGTLDITVLPGDAVSAVINTGPVTDQ